MRKFARVALSLSALLAALTVSSRSNLFAGGPRPTLTAEDVTVAEGEVVEIILTLSAPSVDVVIADYHTAGRTAKDGLDYVDSSGPVIFFPGETTKTILLQTIDDSEVEKNEVFTVHIKSGQAGTPGGPTKVTIVNQ
jgi:hypothetical protein